MARSQRGVLLEKFRQLDKSESAQARGYSFEGLLADLFRNSGLKVYPNATAATPRKIDVAAEFEGHLLLVEAKWQNKEVGVAEIDGLRTCLEDTPADVIGCIFSISDYSESAVLRVKEKRAREILLFNAKEIHGLFSSRFSLPELLRRKRTALRTNAKVWFAPAVRQSSKGSGEALPSGSIFIEKIGNKSPWVTKCTDREEVVFSHELPYVENSSGGQCVGFRVFLDTATEAELRHVLALANRHFGLTAKGAYSIYQTPYAWHGFGAESFLSQLSSWRSRYAKVHLPSHHHSEELSYFDQLDIGMFCLNARQQVVSDNPFIHNAEIELRLPGIPVAPEPFQSFCKELGLESGYFELLADAEIQTIRVYERIPLETSQLIVSVLGDDKNISGAVVKNPFYGKPFPFKDESKHLHVARVFGQCEFIFCAMRDWLPVYCRPGTLVLKSVDAAWAGHSVIMHPVCTWEESTDPRPNSQIEKDQRKRFEKIVAQIAKSEEVPNISKKERSS